MSVKIVWIRHGALRPCIGPYEVRTLLFNESLEHKTVRLEAMLPDMSKPLSITYSIPSWRYLTSVLFLKSWCLKKLAGDYGVVRVFDEAGNLLDQQAFEIKIVYPLEFMPEIRFSKKKYSLHEPIYASIVDIPPGADIVTLALYRKGESGYLGYIDQIRVPYPPYNYSVWVEPFIPLNPKPGTYVMKARIWSRMELVGEAESEVELVEGYQ